MHGSLLAALRERNYSWKQFVVSPIQIGVPNNRKRFYLLCERSDRFQGMEDELHSEFPAAAAADAGGGAAAAREVAMLENYTSEPPPVEDGLSAGDLYLGAALLSKPWARGLSVVRWSGRADRVPLGSSGSR